MATATTGSVTASEPLVINLAGVAPGIYYCKIETKEGSAVKKLMVVR